MLLYIGELECSAGCCCYEMILLAAYDTMILCYVAMGLGYMLHS